MNAAPFCASPPSTCFRSTKLFWSISSKAAAVRHLLRWGSSLQVPSGLSCCRLSLPPIPLLSLSSDYHFWIVQILRLQLDLGDCVAPWLLPTNLSFFARSCDVGGGQEYITRC
ncbi:hypothetical protein TNIN_142001 [Trichonephila inaurata madagascariensis]|uniref:Uncharacterized protein n=1 Tax=Trichonephila inaurata madagascariensis TaxID=2747483 RepID=A0A8X6XJV6_9ARAC|nr:hypothetical protein TNIN_142001 [Trichonephila inaurata madagascariensis]